MRNCLFGFVAHIGEAEGFSLNFAVAGIDHEVVLFSKSFRECRNVEFFSIVPHAGERFRPKTFFGEEIEPGSSHPIVDERVGAGVSIETRVQAFLEDFVEL